MSRRLSRLLLRPLRRWLTVTLLSAAAIGLYLACVRTLRDTHVPSGYVLLGLVAFLALYNLRKRLPFLPIGRASTWLRIHVHAGVFAMVIFALHLGARWPTGGLESTLAAIFAVVAVSGVIGLILSRVIPARLSHGDYHEELIFERIPGAVRVLRGRVEDLVIASLEGGQSPAIADYYRERLLRHFSGARNLAHHLVGSRRHARRLAAELAEFGTCLDSEERERFRDVEHAVWLKDDLDRQFANQGLLKVWLFVHIPATACLLLLAVVHLTLVYAYGAA